MNFSIWQSTLDSKSQQVAQVLVLQCCAPAECSAGLGSLQHLSGHALHLWLHSLQKARPEAVVVSTLREALKHSGPEPECTAAQVATALLSAILLFFVICTLQQFDISLKVRSGCWQLIADQ